MGVGEIYRHSRFYTDGRGELKPKFLLVLANPPNGDVVARLLTSQAHGRPEDPPCFHGLPYGGYFLGVPGSPLIAKTWVDLRHLDDLDHGEFEKAIANGTVALSMTLATKTMCDILACVAASDDTTHQQERHLRDLLATLR